MVRYFDNLPDDDHVPYKFIDAEPHVKDVFRYMRTADYGKWLAVGLGFPAIHWLWERKSPSFHPKVMPRVMLVQVPVFMTIGAMFAMKDVYCTHHISELFNQQVFRPAELYLINFLHISYRPILGLDRERSRMGTLAGRGTDTGGAGQGQASGMGRHPVVEDRTEVQESHKDPIYIQFRKPVKYIPMKSVFVLRWKKKLVLKMEIGHEGGNQAALFG
ncbi:hypothetical protein HDV00_009067 [Rhizophlyctis rosea]|nr:hypothetical protein HDV00_009067 [Rhizophlyctis rosea]